MKQEARWRLEAEEEYQKGKPWPVRVYRWLLRNNLFAVMLGAVVGFLIGEAMDRLASGERDRSQRALIAYEACHRLLGYSAFLREVIEPGFDADDFVQEYKSAFRNSLSPSPFACHEEFRDVPDPMLAASFRAAGGDAQVVAVMHETFNHLWDVAANHVSAAAAGQDVTTNTGYGQMRSEAHRHILGTLERLEELEDLEPLRDLGLE